MALLGKFELKRDLKKTSAMLAKLNRELAEQMILLASQTGNAEPLIDAVKSLRSAQEFYSLENKPRENAEVQQLLANTLLKLGRANNDVAALESAVSAYRGAITIASMLGDEKLRRALKRNYNLARNILGERGETVPLFKVA